MHSALSLDGQSCVPRYAQSKHGTTRTNPSACATSLNSSLGSAVTPIFTDTLPTELFSNLVIVSHHPRAAVGAEFERLPRPVKRHLTHVAPYAVLVFVVGVYHMARGVDEVGETCKNICVENPTSESKKRRHVLELRRWPIWHHVYMRPHLAPSALALPQPCRHLSALFASRCHRCHPSSCASSSSLRAASRRISDGTARTSPRGSACRSSLACGRGAPP